MKNQTVSKHNKKQPVKKKETRVPLVLNPTQYKNKVLRKELGDYPVIRSSRIWERLR